jgi:hypothetical protein
MKQHILLGAFALVLGSLVAAQAGTKDDVISAAKKLAEKGNYSWKSTVENAGGSGGGGARGGGPTEGKIDKGGLICLAMTRGENTIEAFKKGDKGAIKTQEGWQSLAEATASAGTGGGGQPGGGGRFLGRMIETYKAPAAQAEEVAGKTKELKKDGDAYVGELTEEGAKSLLSLGGRGGNNAPEISGAKGSVKFWAKDGVLSKYEIKVQGSMTVNGNAREVDRTTTVDIKDVGSTKITVPEEAAKKLS